MFGSLLNANQSSKNVMTTTERGWLGRFYNTQSNSGMVINEQIAMQCNDVYNCTRFIRNQISSMTQQVKQLLPNGHKKPIESGPMVGLINRPNTEMTPQSFISLLVARLVNRGNAYAWIRKDRYTGMPVELWPIHNSRVIPQRDPDGTPFWEIAVDDFHSRDMPMRLDFENLLNVVWCVGDDGITGQGVLDVGYEEIALNLSAQEYGSKFYQNGARPSGHIEMENFITSEKEMKIFREALEGVHQGRENWQKTGIVWGGKWKESQVSPDKAMMLETREYSSKQICHLYGVPPAMVGYDENQKYDNFEVLMRQFGRTTALAVVTALESAFNFYLVPKGFCYDIDIASVLRADPVAQSEIYRTEREMAVRNANEWRRDTGRNPIDSGIGDEYILPLQFSGAKKVIDGENLKAQTEAANKEKSDA